MRNKQLQKIQTHTDMAYNGAYNTNGVVENTVPVPNDSVGFIIGAKGKTVNLIKRNTGAWVQVQKNGSGSSFLVRGFPHQVREAVNWINTIVEEAGHRGPPPAPEVQFKETDFPSLPGSASTVPPAPTQTGFPTQAPMQTGFPMQAPMPYSSMWTQPPMFYPGMQTGIPMGYVPPPQLASNQVWMMDQMGRPYIYTIPGNVDRDEAEAAHREEVREMEQFVQRGMEDYNENPNFEETFDDQLQHCEEISHQDGLRAGWA